mmetsp:Transcript_17527/g.26616  ORF Transcript_17527/g.26616 Transcript_17527/m.26616 type:complete len:241 (+) Transcript_17527:121-843(+)
MPSRNIKRQDRTLPDKPVQCWAHTKNGTRCSTFVVSREGEPVPVPYCNLHLKSGDGALRKAPHPFAGYCLVANFDLPKNYRMVFWGNRGRCPASNKDDRSLSFYPPNPKTGRNYIPFTRTLKTDNYNGVINPSFTGDLLQYASCPGPNERQNLRSTFQYFGKRNGKIGGLEYVTLEPVPKNTQLCFWYGSGWWSARDIRRQDIGTKRYPAPGKKRKLCNQESKTVPLFCVTSIKNAETVK